MEPVKEQLINSAPLLSKNTNPANLIGCLASFESWHELNNYIVRISVIDSCR